LSVQRSGDSGSPRVTGSTRSSRAVVNPGASAVARLSRMIERGTSGMIEKSSPQVFGV
jgi:hypothetical protein